MHLLELAYSCGANSSGSTINKGGQFKVKTKSLKLIKLLKIVVGVTMPKVIIITNT